MILFYTALIAIPDELMEAAYVDGANAWQIFWRVKFSVDLTDGGFGSHDDLCRKL
jgi:raffinose/stachyose/melibiose transport system permease protein